MVNLSMALAYHKKNSLFLWVAMETDYTEP